MPHSPSEQHQLKSQLLQVDETLQDIRSEEYQLVERLTTLRQERQLLTTQRKRIINTANSPIYVLPNELLSQIFVFFTSTGIVAPSVSRRRAIVASIISNRWRDVAISTPELWTQINMKEGAPFELSAVFLERSGNYPLHVDLDLTRRKTLDSVERDFLGTVLAPHLHRARVFHLSARTMEPFWRTLPRFTAQPAPFLEKFELFLFEDDPTNPTGLDGMWAEQAERQQVSAFGGKAPNLRSMTISGLHVPWQVFSIQGLAEFAFDFHSSDIKRSLKSFYDVVRASRETLRVLTVMQGQAGNGLRIDPSWVVPKVGSVHQNPNLYKRILLPKLEELVYSFVESPLTCDLLRLVKTPNIHSLTMEYLKNDSAPIFEYMTCDPPLFPSMTRLRLLGLTSIGQGRMYHFLRTACTNITHLHINAVNCPTLKEMAHLLRWMALERQEYLIPKLAELSAEGLTPRNLREMIQSRPETLRPKRIVMRRRDWTNPNDDCMEWLKSVSEVQFVVGTSDAEG